MRIIILVTISALLLVGCTPHRYPHLLVTADSLAETHADSALLLLDEWQPQIASALSSDRHYYHLVRLHAEDKAYIPHTSDSIVRTLIDYYGNSHDSPLLPRVYYLAGRVYQDLERMPEAIEYYHKSQELLDTLTDFNLLALTNCHIGTALLFQKNYTEALSYFQKAYLYDKQNNNYNGLVFDCRDIANVYRSMKTYHLSLTYYKKALNYAIHEKRKDMVGELYAQIANIHYLIGDYSSAEQYLNQSLTDVNENDTLCVYAIAVEIYAGINQVNRIEPFLEVLKHYDNIYVKQLISYYSAKIAEENNNTVAAFQEMTTYMACTDSIIARNNSSAIAKLLAMYNYNKKEEEVNQLKQKNEHQQTILLFIVFVSAMSFYAIFRYWKKQKRQQQASLANFEDFKNRQEQLVRISQLAIEEKDKKLASLRQQLDERYGTNKQLQEEIEILRRDIELAKKERVVYDEKRNNANMLIAQSDIYLAIKKRLNNNEAPHHLSEKEWEEMERVVNEAYKGFTIRLKQYYLNMSPHELHISIALKFGLRIKEIAEITAKSNQALASTRSRLYTKVFGNKGVAADWDSFIESL